MSTRSWTQKWVDQVTSGRFRNFSMPRTSLFKHLRSLSKPRLSSEQSAETLKEDNSASAEKRQLFTNPAYNAPFDDVSFAVAKAADVKQRTGDYSGLRSTRSHHNYSTRDPTTIVTATPTTTDSSQSSDSDSDQSMVRERHHVIPVFIGVICFLALLGVIALALYFKLARTTDPKPVDKMFVANMEVKVTNHQFVDDMLNQSSQAFQDFESMFCSNMTAIYTGSTEVGTYRGCTIYNVSRGSIQVSFALFFMDPEEPSKKEVLRILTKEALFISRDIVLRPGLTLADSSLKVLGIVRVSFEDFVPKVPVPKPRPTSTQQQSTSPSSRTTTTTSPFASNNGSSFNFTNSGFNTTENSDILNGNNTNSGWNYTIPGSNDTVPGLNYTTPGGNNTNSGWNYTIPGSNDTVPGLNYTTPGGNYTNPGGNYTNPGWNYTNPGWNYTNPGWNYTNPGGNYTNPGWNYTNPGSNYTIPGLNYTTPGWNYTNPGWNYTTSGGNYTTPGWNYTNPGWNYTTSGGNYTTENGTTSE